MFSKWSIVTILLVAFLAAFLLAPEHSLADSHMEVIAGGLDNPRGLAFGPQGELYVAEAGQGGAGPCITGPEGGEVCFGLSGAITRIQNGSQQRVVTGLPSVAGADGSAAIGPHDLTLRGAGVALVTVGLGANPAVRTDPSALGPAGAELGKLVLVKLQGDAWQPVIDVAGFEAVANPDGGEVDSNPYGIAHAPGKPVLVDAGGNSLLQMRGRGLETVAVFPPRLVPAPPFIPVPEIPMESVPTAVEQGPDGAYYVSELTGFPFPVGLANIYRVAPGAAPTVFASGFTNVIDLAFAPDGSLYVLEIAANSLLSGDPTGALIHLGNDGSRTVLASDGLILPGSVAVGPDGALYVSNCSACPAGAGTVVRILPDGAWR